MTSWEKRMGDGFLEAFPKYTNSESYFPSMISQNILVYTNSIFPVHFYIIHLPIQCYTLSQDLQLKYTLRK